MNTTIPGHRQNGLSGKVIPQSTSKFRQYVLHPEYVSHKMI